MASSESHPGDSAALLRLSPGDNVLVVVRSLAAGASIGIEGGVHVLPTALGLGHKIAARPIAMAEKIIKCHAPIGSATRDIAAGEHVHLHNMKSDYLPTFTRGSGEEAGERS